MITRDPLVNVVPAIEELAARWHRHEHEGGDFKAGMRAGWAQAIALLLGTEYRDVRDALRRGDL